MKNILILFTLVSLSFSLPAQFHFQNLTFENQIKLDTFSPIVYLSGDLVLDGGSINNLSALSTLSAVSGDVHIQNTSQLKNLNGLVNLNLIGGDLIIENNSNLHDLSGFMSLHFIGGNIKIRNNLRLQSLNGFEKIASIAQSLTISGNNELTNLEGFNQLKHVGANLKVEQNEILYDCCAFGDLIRSNGVNGEISVNENPMGCQSAEEIINHCFVHLENQNTDIKTLRHSETTDFIYAFPNPTENDINIKITIEKSQEISLSLFDSQGKKILTKNCQVSMEKHNETLDLSLLTTGVYFLKVEGAGFNYVKKIARK